MMQLFAICFKSIGLGLSSVYEFDRIKRGGVNSDLCTGIGENDSRPAVGVKYNDILRLSFSASTDGDECNEKFGD